MAVSKKSLNEEIKARYFEAVAAVFTSQDLEVLKVGSAEMAIPVLDKNGDEEWLVVTLKVPTGSRDGEAYDGYAMAEDFRMKQEAKAEKARLAAEAKAKKIAKDKAAREAKKAQREQVEGE